MPNHCFYWTPIEKTITRHVVLDDDTARRIDRRILSATDTGEGLFRMLRRLDEVIKIVNYRGDTPIEFEFDIVLVAEKIDHQTSDLINETIIEFANNGYHVKEDTEQ